MESGNVSPANFDSLAASSVWAVIAGPDSSTSSASASAVVAFATFAASSSASNAEPFLQSFSVSTISGSVDSGRATLSTGTSSDSGGGSSGGPTAGLTSDSGFSHRRVQATPIPAAAIGRGSDGSRWSVHARSGSAMVDRNASTDRSTCPPASPPTATTAGQTFRPPAQRGTTATPAYARSRCSAGSSVQPFPVNDSHLPFRPPPTTTANPVYAPRGSGTMPQPVRGWFVVTGACSSASSSRAYSCTSNRCLAAASGSRATTHSPSVS